MAAVDTTPVATIEPLVQQIRATAASRKTHPASWRRAQLRAIIAMVEENTDKMNAALHADLGANAFFSEVLELGTILAEAEYALERLDGWMAPQKVPTPFPTNLTTPVRSEISETPRGTALIVAPWNYPLSLCLCPLIAALAAGNCCAVKPSEVSSECGRLLAELIKQYLDNEAVVVVMGAVPQATELLRLRFDVICYTGNGTVAKIVASAAAKHLTPCLLELGGKSPCIVCEDADIATAALRICWAKYTCNMGQTCVTVDYVLVVDSLKQKLVVELKKVALEMFGDKPAKSADVGRIASVRHAERLVGMLDDTVNVLHGGEADAAQRYMAPTIVEPKDPSKPLASTVMREEIFGPILPVVGVPTVDSAIEFVNSQAAGGNHPLALYVFAKGTANQQKVQRATQSGGFCINDCVKHLGNPNLPFGGVGASGMGAYHGEHGFKFFSHQRAVFAVDNHVSYRKEPGVWMTFAPYTQNKLSAIRLLGKLPKALASVASVLKFALPILLSYYAYHHPELVTSAREFNLNSAMALGLRFWSYCQSWLA